MYESKIWCKGKGILGWIQINCSILLPFVATGGPYCDKWLVWPKLLSQKSNICGFNLVVWCHNGVCPWCDIIDDSVYLLGASVKDMGNGLCAVTKLQASPETILGMLKWENHKRQIRRYHKDQYLVSRCWFLCLELAVFRTILLNNV